jgi:hypothetical protein
MIALAALAYASASSVVPMVMAFTDEHGAATITMSVNPWLLYFPPAYIFVSR